MDHPILTSRTNALPNEFTSYSLKWSWNKKLLLAKLKFSWKIWKRKNVKKPYHFSISLYRVFQAFWFITKWHKSAFRKDNSILKKVSNRFWSADFLFKVSFFRMESFVHHLILKQTCHLTENIFLQIRLVQPLFFWLSHLNGLCNRAWHSLKWKVFWSRLKLFSHFL